MRIRVAKSNVLGGHYGTPRAHIENLREQLTPQLDLKLSARNRLCGLRSTTFELLFLHQADVLMDQVEGYS